MCVGGSINGATFSIYQPALLKHSVEKVTLNARTALVHRDQTGMITEPPFSDESKHKSWFM